MVINLYSISSTISGSRCNTNINNNALTVKLAEFSCTYSYCYTITIIINISITYSYCYYNCLSVILIFIS